MGRALSLQKLLYGQHQSFDEVRQNSPLLDLLKSCGWTWIYKHHVFISARPTICATNEEGQLHHSQHAALKYPDGLEVHAINGVKVPRYVVEAPQKITTWRINKESNIEVRRIMIDRYRLGEEVHGIGAYVRDSYAIKLDYDETRGTLWRLPDGDIGGGTWRSDREDIVMLEVVNRSPEPDGHFKRYWLRVPPDMQSSAQASAWTFGMEAETYNPEIET